MPHIEEKKVERSTERQQPIIIKSEGDAASYAGAIMLFVLLAAVCMLIVLQRFGHDLCGRLEFVLYGHILPPQK
ncbi:MAG TPA: hypothetical protein V6D08_21540 [Candidatus Obscuribacterales bacterium]